MADLTGHIFMDSEPFFLHGPDNTCTLASWLQDAVNGTLRTIVCYDFGEAGEKG